MPVLMLDWRAVFRVWFTGLGESGMGMALFALGLLKCTIR